MDTEVWNLFLGRGRKYESQWSAESIKFSHNHESQAQAYKIDQGKIRNIRDVPSLLKQLKFNLYDGVLIQIVSFYCKFLSNDKL